MSRNLAAATARVALAGAVLFACRAQAQERDPAAAEALFAEGRALMNSGHYAEACAKLAESQRLDPGVGTEFHLATCYEHAGKLASAWAAFLEVASVATASSQHERARAANRRASLLEPRLARVKIVVPSASRAPGLEITRDGIVVRAAQWEVAVPVDPGEHQLEATAPGKRAFAGAVNVAEGTTASFEVPALESTAGTSAPTPALIPPTATPATPAPATPSLAPPPRPEPERAPLRSPQSNEPSSGPNAAVIGIGILGVVGIGAGTVLGLMASAKNKDSKNHCNPMDQTRCDPTGVSLRNKAFTLSDWSTVGFVTGGVALAGAALLWLLSGGSEAGDREAAIAVHAGPTAANVAVEGKF